MRFPNLRQKWAGADKAAAEAVPRPMPPCGEPEAHYYWTDTVSPAGCPRCHLKRLEQSKREEEDAYIDRLAKAIARELKEIL